MSSKARPFIVQGIIAIVVIVIGVWVFQMFFGDKQVPQRRGRMDTGVL